MQSGLSQAGGPVQREEKAHFLDRETQSSGLSPWPTWGYAFV